MTDLAWTEPTYLLEMGGACMCTCLTQEFAPVIRNSVDALFQHLTALVANQLHAAPQTSHALWMVTAMEHTVQVLLAVERLVWLRGAHYTLSKFYQTAALALLSMLSMQLIGSWRR